MKYRIFIDFQASYYAGEVEAEDEECAEEKGEEMNFAMPDLPPDFSEPYIMGINAERVEP